MASSLNNRIPINEINNLQCFKKCNRNRRHEITEEGLCNEVSSELDGLKVRCVGPWALEKIFILNQYFNTFSVAMRKFWAPINYIEICSGPGRCIDRINGAEFNGTPLCIIESNGFNYIDRALFFDYNDDVIDSLNTRFIQRGIQDKATAFLGDYTSNDIVEQIKKHLTPDGLNLVFIDPTDLSVTFKFIEVLKSYFKKLDLIINFAVGTDFNRNIKNILLRDENYQYSYRKYCEFLGSGDFFKNERLIDLAESGNNKVLRTLFRTAYQASLRKIGYIYTDSVLVKNYYDLLYATSSVAGLNLWKNSHKIDHKFLT